MFEGTYCWRNGGSGFRSQGAAEEFKILHREWSIHNNKSNKTSIGCFRTVPCWHLGAWLRPISRGNWHFNGWRLSFSESGPRLESRLLRQSALENVMNLSRTESPRRGGRNKSNHEGGGTRRRRVERGGGRGVVEGGRRLLLGFVMQELYPM
ncbi:hypothetical protein F511_44153 [Dorcoceras hygrometricum]|uniref:Uncharacterized protein n=1 Tax=Dorcoceras hygrometricum TaxID=472368 RepID=A0A2Z7B703_9LAMI|nr:hypothetical protein F511_44153 [Dorcoceras hygrometricum]